MNFAGRKAFFRIPKCSPFTAEDFIITHRQDDFNELGVPAQVLARAASPEAWPRPEKPFPSSPPHPTPTCAVSRGLSSPSGICLSVPGAGDPRWQGGRTHPQSETPTMQASAVVTLLQDQPWTKREGATPGLADIKRQGTLGCLGGCSPQAVHVDKACLWNAQKRKNM